MAHRTVHRLTCLISLLAVMSATKEQTRWSRQLSSYTADISDWVPLGGPVEREVDIPQPQIKRQAVAEPRILSEPFPGITRPSSFSSDSFSSRNYFNNQANRQPLYLQSVPSVPSAPQNYLSDQGFSQGIRFGLSQPNFPLNQGFVAPPPLGFENAITQSRPVRPQALQGIPNIQLSQVSFPQTSGIPLSLQGKPFANPAQKVKSDIPKFVDGYRAENASNEFSFASKKKPQSLQKIKFENGEKVKQEIIPHRSNNERGEEVQLLYVPLEQLNRGQFNFRSPLTTSQLVNTDLYSQNLPRPNKVNQNFLNDYRPSAKPLDTFSGQNYFSDINGQIKDLDQVSKFTTHTTPFATLAPITPKPKKLKPHQPPLAIFMKDAGKNTPLKVGDVLSSLKTAETIAVLDSVNPLNAPKVFIGPSNMPPPENYVKFDLPYLSNIDHSDNKLKQLPFFVAPLSYNTPSGFAKIPFPSPHVGSVVINSQIKETAQSQAPSQPNVNSNYYIATYKPEPKPATQKQTFSYYSTASPTTKPVPNYQSNYYSFEPQTVTSLRTPIQPETQTAPPKTGSYFISNAGPQYNSQEFTNFAPQNTQKSSEITHRFNHPRQPERTTTLRTTTTTTTKQPSTYPSQLLETHNPYSINQAFHFSTPLDYHNYFDDIKQPHVTPGSVEVSSASPTHAPPSPSTSEPKSEHVITEKPRYQPQSPNYLNNYTPEIHYDSDRNTKYPVFNHNDYVRKTEAALQQTQAPNYVDNTQTHKHVTNADTPSNQHNTNIDTSSNQYTNISPELNNYNVDTHNKYNTNIDTPVYNYKTNSESDFNQYHTKTRKSENYKTEYNQNVDTSSPEPGDVAEINNLSTISEDGTSHKYNENNNYDVNPDISEIDQTSSTATSTTTTRRAIVRSRGRPRYTTTPRSDSYESTTRVVITRRPLRERRPPSTRQKYEPNKILTEKPTRKPVDSSESTTRSTKTKTRGRIHYKPSESDELYDRKKTHGTKEGDLAYQRDILHQNYPVTLMERASTVDIEAITEPTHQQSSVNVQEHATASVDTENAYTHERAAVSEQEEVKDISPLSSYTPRSTLKTETPYVPKLPSTRNEDYYYQGRSSIAPVEASAYDESTYDKEEDIYAKQTTPGPKPEKTDPVAYATETTATEQSVSSYSSHNDYATIKQVEENTASEVENTKHVSSENTEIEEEEENVVHTTPSYNRVRVRPGVIRQYHQASSSEAPKIKERRRPQPVTYRPAFDRRRTTMRIDEIEADLKTKQVHTRAEQEHKHPVYRPEATTEPTLVVSSSTTESSTKRNNFRRRRPSYSYSTTSTEASSTKRSYDVKNRFRGRRPTEKSSEKLDVQTESPSSTTRASLHSRYSHRPRLSERYNKKPEVEVEDQDSNFSINRPNYAAVDGNQWSPKISSDSFKPFNPNDIIDEQRIATTESKSNKEGELDIITARNEYEDILLTVTPATNNRMNKKIPDIPPTLEALVEQSKVTKSDTTDTMSTFESMLEEVMKSLEEQDKDEYNSNVMKHKGGEIGEIPPEIVISSGDSYVQKSTMPIEEITTELTTADDSPLLDKDNKDRNSRRRGFWKKVKVRPVTESIEFAESQYYTNTVNHLGQPVKNVKAVHEKSFNVKPKVTTYKPNFQYLSDLFSSGDDFTDVEVIPTVDIHKIKSNESANEGTVSSEEGKKTTPYIEKETQTNSPGDFDLGTGSPDPTVDDTYYSSPTEPVPTKVDDRSDTFSFMNYLFGMTSEGSDIQSTSKENNSTNTTESYIQTTTEQPKTKIVTTESGFIPEEITELASSDSTDTLDVVDFRNINSKDVKTEKDTEDTTAIPASNVESSSVSSFMDPENILSTSMSTEVSHETEICFRGKCIKTSKDIL